MGRKGGGGVTVNGYGVSFRGDENILKLIVVTAAESWDYAKNH